MTIERALRLIAGAFVATSVLLGIYVNPNFLWFTLFVGVNLLQRAIAVTLTIDQAWPAQSTRIRPQPERAAAAKAS